MWISINDCVVVLINYFKILNLKNQDFFLPRVKKKKKSSTYLEIGVKVVDVVDVVVLFVVVVLAVVVLLMLVIGLGVVIVIFDLVVVVVVVDAVTKTDSLSTSLISSCDPCRLIPLGEFNEVPFMRTSKNDEDIVVEETGSS